MVASEISCEWSWHQKEAQWNATIGCTQWWDKIYRLLLKDYYKLLKYSIYPFFGQKAVGLYIDVGVLNVKQTL